MDDLVQALDALPDAVTIQAPDGTVLYGNRAAAGLTLKGGELDPDAARRYLERMVVTREDGSPLDPAQMPAQRIIRGEPAEPVVVRSWDPETGVETWTRVQASPLTGEDGRVRSAVNVIEDITVTKQAERRSAFVAEASALLGSSLDPAVTLQRTAELVVPELADWCAVDLVGRGGWIERVALVHRDATAASASAGARRRPLGAADDGGVGRVLRTGEPRLYREITPDDLHRLARDSEHLHALQRLGFVSALVVPLRIGDRIIGAVTWASGDPRRRYGPADLETAAAIAARAAVAAENARVHAARVEIATVLQDALLPDALPTVAGWELASHFRAAGEANEVGGDFYDVVELEGGALLALVGDVAGKGARAAAVTARTRHTLVAAAALGAGDATDGLALVNRALQLEDGFELCSVLVVVVRDGVLSVTSAGHPLPLIVRDGAVQEVGATSPMLGAAPPDRPWTTTTTRLLPGDLLVLHTDGVTDAVGVTERFGDERLHATLLDGPPGAQAAVDRLVARLDHFESGPQADDRAVLALRLAA